MKKILFIQREAPYISIRPQEGLEMLMLASSFNFQITLLFLADGIWQLVKDQDGKQVGRKNLGAMLQSLPLFDIHAIFAEESGLNKRNLTESDLGLSVTPVASGDISALMRSADLIINL